MWRLDWIIRMPIFKSFVNIAAIILTALLAFFNYNENNREGYSYSICWSTPKFPSVFMTFNCILLDRIKSRSFFRRPSVCRAAREKILLRAPLCLLVSLVCWSSLERQFTDPDAVENCACSVFFRDRLGAYYWCSSSLWALFTDSWTAALTLIIILHLSFLSCIQRH